MTPYYSDDLVTIYHGDCREWMPEADVLFADPPYGAGKAEWDGVFPREWMDAIPSGVGAAAVTPGQRNVLTMPETIGDMRYRWMLAPTIANATVRGDLGFGNWIPTLLYARDGVSLYGPRQDTRAFAIRGDMPDHPSPKPLAVMRWIVDCLPPGTVLDPFMGSGTTLLAAKEAGRKSIGIEIEERYCEIAATRCSQEVLGLVG